MRARKVPKVNNREAGRAARYVRSERNDGSSTKQDRDVLIATLTELHGRSSEVARRMVDDARMLAELQRETSAVLLKLWNLRSESTRLAPAESPSELGMSAPSTPPNTGPRFLRFRELVKRV